MGNFSEDLKVGEKAQNFLIKKLQDEFPGLHSMQGNFSNYDLVSNSGYTIEIKFDLKSKITGNIAIEYEYDEKPSGIAKTKAMEWIHICYLDNRWVFSRVKVSDLKSYIKNNWKYLKKLKGGDRNSSKMVIINIDDFVNTFDYFPIGL